jgi:sulfite exporter TauE/SafE
MALLVAAGRGSFWSNPVLALLFGLAALSLLMRIGQYLSESR